MLRPFSIVPALSWIQENRAQDCLDRAVQCDRRAEAARDADARDTFAEAARCWREIAECWDELRKHR